MNTEENKLSFRGTKLVKTSRLLLLIGLLGFTLLYTASPVKADHETCTDDIKGPHPCPHKDEDKDKAPAIIYWTKTPTPIITPTVTPTPTPTATATATSTPTVRPTLDYEDNTVFDQLGAQYCGGNTNAFNALKISDRYKECTRNGVVDEQCQRDVDVAYNKRTCWTVPDGRREIDNNTVSSMGSCGDPERPARMACCYLDAEIERYPEKLGDGDEAYILPKFEAQKAAQDCWCSLKKGFDKVVCDTFNYSIMKGMGQLIAWAAFGVFTAVAWTKGAFKTAWNWTKGAAKSTGNWFKGAGKTIGNTAKNVGKTIGNTAKNVGKAVGNFFKGL